MHRISIFIYQILKNILIPDFFLFSIDSTATVYIMLYPDTRRILFSGGHFMQFIIPEKQQWQEIKKIYLEAFPKRERKPYFMLRHAVRRKKATVMAAVENGQLLGFTALIPYHDMVMVDYLAVSSKIRSNGTGSRLLQNILKQFPDKKIVLLIERPDTAADNTEQRIARRRFYLKNSFVSSDIFITGASGDMEVLVCGGAVSREEYMDMQRYALGDMLFRLSHIRIAEG